MEFEFSQVKAALGGDDINVWDADELAKCAGGKSRLIRTQQHLHQSQSSPFHQMQSPTRQVRSDPRERSHNCTSDIGASAVANGRVLGGHNRADLVTRIIDRMGAASAKAQGLGAIITSTERLRANPGHVCFFAAKSDACLGFIKLGVKKLFVHALGSMREIEPLCVLDFYVHERCQRQGVGLALFTRALAHFSVEARQMGYDRPSPKFLAFLDKHHGLRNYTPQNNNFVVFDDFFNDASTCNNHSRRRIRNGDQNMQSGNHSRFSQQQTEMTAAANAAATKIQAQSFSSWFDKSTSLETYGRSEPNQHDEQVVVAPRPYGNPASSAASTGSPIRENASFATNSIETDPCVRQVSSQLSSNIQASSPSANVVVSSRNYFASNRHQNEGGIINRMAQRQKQNSQRYY